MGNKINLVTNQIQSNLKRAYDRNFPRDQLFATLGNFDVTNHPYSGIILLIVYLDC